MPIPTPSTVAPWSAWLGGPCVAQWAGGSRICYPGPLRGIPYIQANIYAIFRPSFLAALEMALRKQSSCERGFRNLPKPS
jgi:hypothetical protein